MKKLISNILIISFIIFLTQVPSYIAYNTNMVDQIRVYQNSKENIQNLTFDDWKIIEFSPFDIIKVGDFYEVYVRVANSCEWTNDFIRVKSNGEIIKQDLVENMKRDEC
ncbi:MAG: hypothetical protein AABY22_37000 [Nanoarchaeota archaeon]